jgi:hypothetical protein
MSIQSLINKKIAKNNYLNGHIIMYIINRTSEDAGNSGGDDGDCGRMAHGGIRGAF